MSRTTCINIDLRSRNLDKLHARIEQMNLQPVVVSTHDEIVEQLQHNDPKGDPIIFLEIGDEPALPDMKCFWFDAGTAALVYTLDSDALVCADLILLGLKDEDDTLAISTARESFGLTDAEIEQIKNTPRSTMARFEIGDSKYAGVLGLILYCPVLHKLHGVK